MKSRFAFITSIIAIILLCSMSYFLWDSTRPFHHGPKSDHFDGKRFHNYNPSHGTFKLLDIMKWQYYEFKEDIKKLWPEFIDDITYDNLMLTSRLAEGELKISFINHSTQLIQIGNINLITDPVFSARVSPIKWHGPKRYRYPGIPLEKLPPIDYILVTHDHYDHCDIGSLKKIQKIHKAPVISGLGMKNFLKKSGINAIELDWWQGYEVNSDVQINFVPAIHWSGRYGLLGNNRTLWGSFVVTTNYGNIYFSGDTAFGEGHEFAMIKEKYGSFIAALIPIGAYEPRWFMYNHHINPEEAVKIHQILSPELSIAMHFGTFALSQEGEGTPEEDLRSALRKYKIPQNNFLIPYNGHQVDLLDVKK